jgi:peptidoglycan/LPS O-acetylase OafA/YrhL
MVAAPIVNGAELTLGHRPPLTGIRGVAVLAVLAHHVWGRGVGGGGHVGVGMFFVLSGFLITSLLVEEHLQHGRVKLGQFYIRRAIRLIPALYAMLLVVAVVSLIFLQGDARSWVLKSVGAAALYLTGFASFFGYGVHPSVGPTWSLAVEEQFYLAWPFFLLFAFKLRWSLRVTAGVTIGLAAAVIAFRIASWLWWGGKVYQLPTTWADALFIGCALGLAWKAGLLPKRLPRIVPWIAWFGLGALSLYPIHSSTFTYAFVLTAIAILAAVVIYCSLIDEDSTVSRILGCVPLQWTGNRSYAIYLWNAPLIFLVPDGIPGREILLIAAAAVTLIVAEASWRVVEAPMLRLKRRFASPLPR